MNDAIGVALAIRLPIDRRQMAIVFTDGFDSSSLLTEADVMLLAGRSRTSLFLVSQKFGMTGDSFSPLGAAVPVAPGPRNPTAFLERLAAATGGLAQAVPSFTMMVTRNTVTGSATVFKPNTTLLDEPFLKALDDFRSSYVLAVQPELRAARGLAHRGRESDEARQDLHDSHAFRLFRMTRDSRRPIPSGV